MTKLNKALLASTAIAFAGGLALPAVAQDAADAPAVVKSSKKMKLTLYGQVARGFGFISDGENQQFRQGQLSTTSSRMGVDGRGKINKDWSLRTRFEFQLEGDTGFDPQENGDGNRERFRIRHTDAIFSNKALGAIWLGRGDTSSNGITEITMAPGMDTAHLGGDLAHVMNGVDATLDSNGADSGRDVRNFFSSFDGAGRSTRIRYDTPSFSGFKASVSYIDSANLDAALRYSGGAGSTKVQGGVSFSRIEQSGTGNFNEVGPEDTSLLAGSFSVRMGDFGVTMSGAHQWYDAAGRDNAWNVNPSIWYVMNATEVGPTTLEVSYEHAENVGQNGDEGDAFGVTVSQVLKNTGTDTYLTFRYYDMSQTGPDLNEAWIIGAGFRARF